jgi:RimJ/RimL family protein N-acetyltransferase
MTYDKYIYDKEKVDRYYQNKVLDTTRCFFAICYNDKVIGEIQIKRIVYERLCGTLSIHLINDAVKGKGFGTEAERLIIDYAIHDLGLRTIYADTIHRNFRSKHILEKLGFRHLYNDEDLAYYEFIVE